MARNVTLEGPDPIDVGVGLRVGEIRRDKKLSQQDLAEACGVTYQQLQKYERGRNRISASMLIRLSRALDCYAGDLLPPEHGEANQVSPRVMAIVASVSGAEALVRAFARIASEEERDQLFQVAAVIAKHFDQSHIPSSAGQRLNCAHSGLELASNFRTFRRAGSAWPAGRS